MRTQPGSLPYHAAVLLVALALCGAAAAWSQDAEAPAAAAVEAAPAAAAEGQVLVDGTPPLTVEMVERFTKCLEWILDAQFTDAQRAEIRASAADTWSSGVEGDMEAVVQLAALHAQLPELADADRELLRQALQEQILSGAREDPTDESNAWILALYDAAHEPLAEGPPALTRQMTDAFSELLAFMVAQATGQETVAVDAAMKDEFAASVTGQWPGMAAEERERYTSMPLMWAALHSAWPGMTEDEKQRLRDQWKEQLAPMLPQPVAAQEPVPEATVADGAPVLASEDAAGYLARGGQYADKSEWEAAIADFSEALKREPASIAALVARGDAYQRSSQRDQATDDYTRAADLDPRSVEAQKGLYECYSDAGATDQAKVHWAKMRELQGQSASEEAWSLEVQQRMAASQLRFQTMSNILRMQHETNMMIINNIGGWSTTYRYY
jgi:tetratricopeptide (TPR) repeat protein